MIRSLITKLIPAALITGAVLTAADASAATLEERVHVVGNIAYGASGDYVFTETYYEGNPVYVLETDATFRLYRRQNGTWYIDFNELDEQWSGTIAVGPWEDAQNANRRQTGLASWANDQDVMWVDPALVSDPALGPNYNANQVTVNQIRRAGVLAHEAVHAYCDIHRMSAYNELTEEAVGYVTQQLVLDVFFDRFLDGSTPEQNRVMREASAVVIACGLSTRSGRGRDVSRHELQRLRDAIQGYAPYSHLTEHGANIHHDGVEVGRRRCRALQAGRE